MSSMRCIHLEERRAVLETIVRVFTEQQLAIVLPKLPTKPSVMACASRR